MRVLMINTVDTARNGITSVIFNYVRSMGSYGAVFDLVSINEPSFVYVDAIEKNGGTVFVVPRNMKGIVKYFSTIKKIVRENNYDLVHIHGNSGTCAIEALAARLANTSGVAVHAHSSSCKYRTVHKVLKPILNKLADARFACSDSAGKFLFGNNPYCVMNNAIDAEKNRYHEIWRQQIRQKHGIPGDAVLVGHVGTFTYAKNHEFLLRVFHSFHLANANSVLMLIGEGENEAEIRAQIQELALEDCVILTGGVDNVNEYMSAFDCFAFPSRFEGLGLVLLEAQASGLTCLASTGVPEQSNVAEDVKFIGLDQSPQLWAQELVACISGEDRQEKSETAIRKISDHGYDIKREVAVLWKCYADVCK